MMNGSRGNFILIVIFIILITHPFHALCQKHSRKDTLSEFSLPSCGVAATKSLKKRYRVAFISHDSAIATFFHNPEQGSRDAANMIDVDIEWNHYLGVSVPKMVKDIHDAVDKGIDGIIVSVPSQEVSDAVQYALNKNVPVIVFNTGLKYAISLGLTRVLQDDIEAGIELGTELSARNFSKPLIVQISSFDQETSSSRMAGIHKSIGSQPDLLKIADTKNNTITPEQYVRDAFLSNQQYDSVISIGGASCADIVASAMLEIKHKYPDRNFATGFFDIGGDKMANLFRIHKDTVAVSQLPYYQTALPVFYMYLRLVTGEDVFANQTIKTGPNLVTNTTLTTVLQNEQNSLLSINDKSGTIGALVANTRGDTYNAAMMAGVTNLAQKLNWTVYNIQEDGPLHKPETFKENLDTYLQISDLKGLIVQTSDSQLLEAAINSINDTSLRMVTLGSFFEKLNGTTSQAISNIALDIVTLAKSIANQVARDGKLKPVCLIEVATAKLSPFCSYFYEAYQEIYGNAASVNMSEVIQPIKLSFPGVMESEFLEILESLHDQGYEPDCFIAFSEYVFSVINNVLLKGYIPNPKVEIYTAGELFDQNQAYLEGRVKSLWATNMFSIGFMSLLHIAVDHMVDFPSWEHALISVPRIEHICEPGKYHSNFTTSAYCQDNDGNTRKSIQCLQCPENMYTDSPNQDQCKPCAEGYYASLGSSVCTSCYEETNDANNLSHNNCAVFVQSKKDERRKIYMAIFIPIGSVLFLISTYLVYRYLKRRFIRQRALGSDDTWLLSFNELVKPQINRLESSQNIQLRNRRISRQNYKNNDKYSTEVDTVIMDDWQSMEGDGDHIISQRNRSSSDSFPESLIAGRSDGPSKVGRVTLENKKSTSRNQSDSFFIRTIGYHYNLPVFIKQIGVKKVRVDDTIRKEVLSMKNTRHPNLIEFVGLILENQRTFIVEEYCSKGSLADVLANPDIKLAWIFRFSLINDLVNGMKFLHRSKFLYHGVLTSDCCMVTGRWELKISNYGFKNIRATQVLDSIDFSTLQRNQKLVNINNDEKDVIPRVINSSETLLWLAPETVSMIESSQHYITNPSKAADVYSAGIIINEILTRAKPYIQELDKTDPASVFQEIRDNGLRPRMQPPKQDGYTDGINKIIHDCLHPNPTLRPSFKSIGSRVELIDPSFYNSDSVVDNMGNLLEQYADDMEALVKKRTQNLQQRTLELEEERARTDALLKDLKSAKEVAEAAAASKQNFLANMSHEIRTPMNAVIGMSRSLMESDLPPDLLECAEIIESSGNHLMALINDILDFSKIESGKLKIERSKLDLTYVIESATKLISTNFLSKGIVLWYDIDPELPVRVWGDLVRLRQILLNLLSNAFKFTNEGYVSISVTAYKQDSRPINDIESTHSTVISSEKIPQISTTQKEISSESFIEYLFTVKDTGIGIPSNKAHKLFQSFSQVDASTTRNYGGTGLGLAISQKLCRLMGGDMWAESEKGKGSTFYFKISLEQQKETKTFREEYQLDELSKKSPKILIILENKYIRLKWESVLHNLNMTDYVFMSQRQAQNCISEAKNKESLGFTLIIIDLDFSIINDNTTMSSHSVLHLLQNECELVKNIPTLCVIDSRLRKDKSSPSDKPKSDITATVIQQPQACQESTPTPNTEVPDPLDQLQKDTENSTQGNSTKPLHLHIIKPFKNTRLIGVLHELLGNSLSPTSKRRMSIGPMNNLPSRRGSIKPGFSVASPLKEVSSESESSRPIRTLVVDDNQINIKVLTKMLGQLKIIPEVANNGREAFEITSKRMEEDEPFDLIFMDIWMPEMNGFEASEKIRKEASISSVKPYIVALTACVMPGDREKCINAGMNGYVSKPVRKEELEASIHTFTQTVYNP